MAMREYDIEREMDRAARYGVQESNPVWMGEYDHTDINYDVYCHLSDPDLVKVDRIRLLTEGGYPYYDISYVWGTLKDGTHVRVSVDEQHLPRVRPGKSLNSILVDWASKYGRHAKRLGMFDAVSLLR